MRPERSAVADQFPTLEAAATLVLAILAWRALLLARDLRAVTEINDELVALLERAELKRAIGCCEALARASYARVARRIVAAARDFDPIRDGESATEVLHRVGATEAAALDRRCRSGRARDLAGLAVLLGATVYGFATELGTWFVGMSVGGACLMLVGGWLRGRIAARSRDAARGLAAAAAHAAGSPGARAFGDSSGAEPTRPTCPRCSEGVLVKLASPEAWRLQHAATGDRSQTLHTIKLADLEACPVCGCLLARARQANELLAELRAADAGSARDNTAEEETD